MELIKEYDVTKIVIGLPLNMDGSEGFMVEAVRKFSAALKARCPIEIVELDERLTSMEAERALNQASIKGKKKKAKVDGMAAQIILRTYLSML